MAEREKNTMEGNARSIRLAGQWRLLPAVVIGWLLTIAAAERARAASLPLPPEISFGTNLQTLDHLIVTVGLDDGTPIKAIIDYGHDTCINDRLVAHFAGKRFARTSTRLEVAHYRGIGLSLNGTALKLPSTIPVFQFPEQNDPKAEVDAYLGWDCLKNYCVQIDPLPGVIRFLDRRKLDVKNLGSRHELGTQLGRLTVKGNLFGAADSRAFISLMVPADGQIHWFNFEVAENERKLRMVPYTQPLTGHAYKAGILPEGRCFGHDYSSLLVQNNAAADLIGGRFIFRHRATFDGPGDRLYLAPVDDSIIVARNRAWLLYRTRAAKLEH